MNLKAPSTPANPCRRGLAFLRRVGFLLFLALASPAFAGVEKLASISDQGICPYWRPIVPALEGWVRDNEAEDCARAPNGISVLVRPGQTFENAPAIIYARAMYKPTLPKKAKSLKQFIRNDMAAFKQDFPDFAIDKLPAIQDGDGKRLPCYAFRSEREGYWELVAYGEEGDYYLIFTLSGKTKSARDAARRDFERFVSLYKEHL